MPSSRPPAAFDPLPAGEFSAWLRATRQALRSGSATVVACGDCVGCCTSSYFIHITPDEPLTLARIPSRLLVPAPGLPRGHALLGYSDDGACPMFRLNACSIYDLRPRTCRLYDCRLFAAAGIPAGGPDKARINARVLQWQFTYASTRALREHDAVRAAASFLLEHAASFPTGNVPSRPTDVALIAVTTYGVFLRPHPHVRRPAELAKAVIASSKRFQASLDPTPVQPNPGVQRTRFARR